MSKRAHQVAKELGVESEVVMAILEELGESAKAVSSVSPEVEAIIRERLAPAPQEPATELPGEVLELDGEPGEGILEEGLLNDAETYAASIAEEVISAAPALLDEVPEGYEVDPAIEQLEEADFVAKYGYDEQEVADTLAGLEVTPAEQRFAVVDSQGQYLETLKLDPGLAEKVSAILGPDRKIAAHCTYPESGEFSFVTHPDAQLHRVFRDE